MLLLQRKRKIEKDFKKMKWHVKIHAKMPFYQRERRSDIFPPFGVPLCALDLQNAAFATEDKIEKDFEKMKWHVKIHEKCHSIRKKRTDIFPPFGVPLCALDLQNAAFATATKLKKTLKKRKWHVKIHEKMPFY